jgi:MFS transporter, ACS family, glucarate transporter
LSLLLVITYLDRVCIAIAGPRMQDALHISPVGWGVVTGAFTLAYGLFEVPAGILGDRIGARRVLTRIVLWWSAFTTLTGFVTGFYPLIVTRFLFGVGEAGAYPNANVVVGRWFPVHERGRAIGILLMASQLGGAVAPFLVVPLQLRYGWRASFFVFGVVGVVWSIVWFFWFRDSPAQKPGVSPTELTETEDAVQRTHLKMPWSNALKSLNFWAVLAVALCYLYTFSFFQSWMHTYLVRARGFSEQNLLFSSLPFLVAAAANVSGGLLSNTLVKKIGLKWGRCLIGVISLGASGLCTVALMFTDSQVAAIVLLSLLYACITLQQPIMFAVCLDIAGPFVGAVTGAMNTAAQLGGFISSIAFGFIVDRSGSYVLPFVPMAALLFLGSLLWLKIDPRQPLIRVSNAR